MANFDHLDYTDSLNRIITALTGIRDDIRLLRTLQEDPESGIVTSNVLNDFQRALLAVSLSTAAGGTAAAVAGVINGNESVNGGGVADPSGDSNGDLDTERTTILEALGQDPASTKVLIRVDGQYYWEAAGTTYTDEVRGETTVVTQFALGEQLGYDNQATGAVTPGVPSGPPDGIPDPGKPKKRWPVARPEGAAASPLANPNSDLVDPATGQVVGRSDRDQQAATTSGGPVPPAVVFTPQ